MFDDLRDTLEGIRVVAVATNIPGPLAAGRLRSLGAEVVKIEPPHGDPLAGAAPGWYAGTVTGMEILQLDLRDDVALRALDAHVASADVVLTAMRARTLERLGLVWERLHARFPRLILVTLTGEAPPNDDRAGHDLTYQARAGTVAPPAMPRTLVGDMAAAERLVAVTLAALLRRQRTDRGAHVRVNIVDCAQTFAEPYVHGLTREDGELGGCLPTYRIYAAAEGYVAVAALEPHFLERLASMLQIEELTSEALARALKERTALEWERLAETHDVPLAAVR